MNRGGEANKGKNREGRIGGGGGYADVENGSGTEHPDLSAPIDRFLYLMAEGVSDTHPHNPSTGGPAVMKSDFEKANISPYEFPGPQKPRGFFSTVYTHPISVVKRRTSRPSSLLSIIILFFTNTHILHLYTPIFSPVYSLLPIYNSDNIRYFIFKHVNYISLAASLPDMGVLLYTEWI